jgi:hypothetical protein
MRKEDVPQDQGLAEGLNEVTYAVDDQGNYVMAPSSGWEPKSISNYQAWEVIGAQIESARQQVANNEVAPLAYHMARNQMDITLLAQYMGIMRWRVKRHLKPKIFKKLPPHLLDRYAGVLKLTVAQLQDIELVEKLTIPGQEQR